MASGRRKPPVPASGPGASVPARRTNYCFGAAGVTAAEGYGLVMVCGAPSPGCDWQSHLPPIWWQPIAAASKVTHRVNAIRRMAVPSVDRGSGRPVRRRGKRETRSTPAAAREDETHRQPASMRVPPTAERKPAPPPPIRPLFHRPPDSPGSANLTSPPDGS